MKLIILLIFTLITQTGHSAPIGGNTLHDKPPNHPIDIDKNRDSRKKDNMLGSRLSSHEELLKHKNLIELIYSENKILVSRNDLIRIFYIDPEAVSNEIVILNYIANNAAKSTKEREIAEDNLKWLAKIASAINTLDKIEATKIQVARIIEIARVISSLKNRPGSEDFHRKFSTAISGYKSIEESIQVASNGKFTESDLYEAFRAESVLPEQKTNFINNAHLYIEYRNGLLFFNSNFTNNPSEEGIIKYPTKLTRDLDKAPKLVRPVSVFAEIFSMERHDIKLKKQISRALLENSELLVDVSVFDNSGIPRIDLTGIKNIIVTNGSIKRSVRIEAEIMQTSKPPPSLISKIKGCCLYARPPYWAKRFSKELSKIRFDAKKIKFASLFIDSGTEDAIAHSSLVNAARLKGDSDQLRSKADIKKMFENAKGQTLIMIGHIEGADYVIRSSGNIEQMRTSIADIRSLAKENEVQLIDIGCETIKAIEDESFGLGVMTTYNSIEAVKSIERASYSSATLEDFLTNISSENLRIVLEPSFLKSTIKSLSIYSRIRQANKAIWAKIASITFSHFN